MPNKTRNMNAVQYSQLELSARVGKSVLLSARYYS